MRAKGLVWPSAVVAAFLSAAGAFAEATVLGQPDVIRVGFLAADQLAASDARMEPFRAYIESRIGIPVELVPAATYESLIDATVGGQIQYGVHSATSFAVAQHACDCIEPLALPSAYDGSMGFYSVLLARADGAIGSLADARGKRLAVSGEDSVAGRLVPLAELMGQGIDPESYFSGVLAVPGPEAAVSAVLSGEADLAVGWSSLAGDPSTGYSFGLLTRMVIDGRLPPGAVKVIWRSSLIPFGPHAVRNDLPSEMKLRIADALFDMAFVAPEALEAVDRSGFGGGGFVAVDPGAYAVIGSLVASH